MSMRRKWRKYKRKSLKAEFQGLFQTCPKLAAHTDTLAETQNLPQGQAHPARRRLPFARRPPIHPSSFIFHPFFFPPRTRPPKPRIRSGTSPPCPKRLPCTGITQVLLIQRGFQIFPENIFIFVVVERHANQAILWFIFEFQDSVSEFFLDFF